MTNTIDEIEGLLARATPGPWIRLDKPGCRPIKGGKSGRHHQARYRGIAGTFGLSDDKEDSANATLIVALVNAAPDLIAVVRAAAKVSHVGDGAGVCGSLFRSPKACDCENGELIEALARLGVKP